MLCVAALHATNEQGKLLWSTSSGQLVGKKCSVFGIGVFGAERDIFLMQHGAEKERTQIVKQKRTNGISKEYFCTIARLLYFSLKLVFFKRLLYVRHKRRCYL